MKFRARMIDSHSMREFSNTIHTLSKLGKQAAISLTPDKLSFVVFEDGAPRRPLAQCIIDQKHFFNDFDVMGVSVEHNQICLEFSPDLLSKATSSLKSPQTSKSIKLKLTKKDIPCLTCEIEMQTHLKQSRMCTHDIPVEIIPRKSWPEFQLPALPEFDLSIEMPQLKRFKNICERMKILSSQLILEASPSGIIALKTETDLATVSTYFTNLRVENSEDYNDPDERFEVKVDFKKIIGFLSIEQVNPNKVVCNIVNKKLIFMEVIHDNFSLHYLIPGMVK